MQTTEYTDQLTLNYTDLSHLFKGFITKFILWFGINKSTKYLEGHNALFNLDISIIKLSKDSVFVSC